METIASHPDHQYPDPARRLLITASTMLSAIMVTLDSTIANVALPHIQSTLSASPEQIVWVVTSYVIATAIATPLAGWLATRYGRKYVMAGSVACFTIASAACGLAANLPALVLFRFIQGLFGAATVPLSQAVLLDAYPPGEYGRAMAIYGLGSMLGGVAGPVVGGFLTEMLNWRWIFLVNIPVGLLASGALFTFLPQSQTRKSRFDMFGFAMLSLFLASLQLMIDRGQHLDWFESPEILAEATVAVMTFIIFIVHILTAREPFITPRLFTNRNFVAGAIIATGLGVLVFGAMPLFGTMLQQMMGYPVMLTGMMLAPRSVGTALAMLLAGRLIGKIDARLLMFIGIALTGAAFHMMSGMSLEMDERFVITSSVMMGIGAGFLFVPLSTMAFTTLPLDLRNEGTAMVALFRFIGTAVGVSLLQILTIQNSAAVQSRLTEGLRPDNPNLVAAMPEFDFGAASSAATLVRMAARQAQMVAYIDTWWLLFLISMALLPLAFVMRMPKTIVAADDVHMVGIEG